MSEVIRFWNRHEVYVGLDLGRFSKIRDILEDEKIEYKYRAINMGSIGIGRNVQIMYYVYVHKKDAEIASHLRHQHLR